MKSYPAHFFADMSMCSNGVSLASRVYLLLIGIALIRWGAGFRRGTPENYFIQRGRACRCKRHLKVTALNYADYPVGHSEP